MEKEFVPYELSLKLKALCFNEPCFGYYENQSKILVINFNNLPLTEEQNKRPGLYTINHSNEVLPQWAVAAPTFQQAFKWIREKYSGYHGVSNTGFLFELTINGEFIRVTSTLKENRIFRENGSSYEEVELACLEKMIEVIEQK